MREVASSYPAATNKCETVVTYFLGSHQRCLQESEVFVGQNDLFNSDANLFDNLP